MSRVPVSVFGRFSYKAKVYSPQMINTLLATAKDTDMYLPILLFVTAGLKRGELLALSWTDVDFEKNTISIRNNLVRGENGYIIKPPKSESGLREIHLGSQVMYELRKARAKHFADIRLGNKPASTSPFVINQENGEPYTPDAMSRKWKRFLVAHNLPDLPLHGLRHSNATALIQAGVSPKVVQQRLGHSDVSITLNTYTHVLPEMDIEAASKIEDIMMA